MGKSYRAYLPEQDLLLPPSLREWLPENHLVYFVSDVIDNLNLSALDAVYGDEQRGQPPYDPRMMTKVLVYGYCVGVFSSRRIERRLIEDVGFRVLAPPTLSTPRPYWTSYRDNRQCCAQSAERKIPRASGFVEIVAPRWQIDAGNAAQRIRPRRNSAEIAAVH